MTDRKVSRRGAARTLTITRVYDTTVEDLWDACTNPERLPRWFLPVSGELQPGGRYSLQGNADGTIERCEPPRELDLTWEARDEISWVELRLSEAPEGKARFTLDHIAEVKDDFWDQYGPGAVGVGWELALDALGLYLGGGTPNPVPDPAVVAAISDGWYEASVAFGTPEAAARTAADNTTAFYTGG